MSNKIFRPSLLFAVFGLSWVIAFFMSGFSMMLIGPDKISLSSWGLSLALVWVISGIILATGKLIITDDGFKCRFTFFDAFKEIKWNEIAKVTYLKMPLLENMVYVHYTDAGKDRFVQITNHFSHHRQIIREIVARIPKGIPVDPRLYTSELDRNVTVEMFVEGVPGLAAFFLLMFVWDKIDVAANMPQQDLRTKVIVCLTLILPMYWLVPKIWEKIKPRAASSQESPSVRNVPSQNPVRFPAAASAPSALDRPLFLVLIWFALSALMELPLENPVGMLGLPRLAKAFTDISLGLLISAGLLGSIYASYRKIPLSPSLRFKTCAIYSLIRVTLALAQVEMSARAHAHRLAFFSGIFAVVAAVAAILMPASYWVMGWASQLTLKWAARNHPPHVLPGAQNGEDKVAQIRPPGKAKP